MQNVTFQSSFQRVCIALAEQFRQHAHAIRFVVGLRGTQKFHPIVKYEHYQIPSGARASPPNH